MSDQRQYDIEMRGLRYQFEEELSKTIGERDSLRAQLASARKALEEIAGESGSKYPSSIPISVAKRALAALTDEQGAA